MKYDEFTRQVGKAGLTIRDFASLIDTHPGSISNYGTKGAVPPRYAVLAVVLGEMAEKEIDFRGLLDKHGYATGIKRGANVSRIEEYRARGKRTVK